MLKHQTMQYNTEHNHQLYSFWGKCSSDAETSNSRCYDAKISNITEKFNVLSFSLFFLGQMFLQYWTIYQIEHSIKQNLTEFLLAALYHYYYIKSLNGHVQLQFISSWRQSGAPDNRGYHIYLAIRWGFPLSTMTTNNWISPMKFCYNTSFTLP